MIKSLVEIYEMFRKQGAENPLEETLHLADLLVGGALRNADLSMLESKGIDIDEVIRKRVEGQPIEYILGEAPFLGEMLSCDPGALIPREETELLTLTCLDYIEKMQEEGREKLKIAELGTGSGNIAVLIALRSSDTEVYASDISEEALEIARKNVERFDVGDRVTLLSGDMFEPLGELGLENGLDMVVCNPPYIPSGSVDKLDSGIKDHEPRVALDAGAYGLDFFRNLIKGSPEFLRPGGILAFEIGVGQEKLVTRLLSKSGDRYDRIDYHDDGNDIRVISAIRA
jgi:release factor glutamine methyltransferase